jgi:hypothetical protein
MSDYQCTLFNQKINAELSTIQAEQHPTLFMAPYEIVALLSSTGYLYDAMK